MKRLLLLCLLALSASSPAFAARIAIIKPHSATQFEGSVMAVRGIAQVRENEQLQGIDVRLLGPDGRVQFVGFIPRLNEYAFPHVKALDGKEVVMYGVMEIYHGHGATQLLYRDQVQAWPVVPRTRRAA